MSSDRAILLISDRPDRSQVLARRFGGLCTCRTKGLYEQESTAELVTAVVTDVRFRHPSDIERLHHLLSKPRALAAPIVAILRDNSYLQRVQAGEVGATFLFPANVSVSSALAPVFRSTIPWVEPTTSLAPAQSIEQARLHFGTIFNAAARGEGVSRTSVDNATASVMAAIAAGGIRRWLEVVWTYDEATYQHNAFWSPVSLRSSPPACSLRGAIRNTLQEPPCCTISTRRESRSPS